LREPDLRTTDGGDWGLEALELGALLIRAELILEQIEIGPICFAELGLVERTELGEEFPFGIIPDLLSRG
jgi:hypothetical protein